MNTITYCMYMVKMESDNLWIRRWIEPWSNGPEYVEIGWARGQQSTNAWYPNKPEYATHDAHYLHAERYGLTTLAKEEVVDLPLNVQQAIAEFLLGRGTQ